MAATVSAMHDAAQNLFECRSKNLLNITGKPRVELNIFESYPSSSNAATTARKNVAAKVPRFSLAFMESKVSPGRPWALSFRASNSNAANGEEERRRKHPELGSKRI